MRQSYSKAIKIILGYEGGNVDDPADNGGRTSRGVTQRVYSAYRVKKGRPNQDVFRATDAEVADIYKRQYWDINLCDELPAGVDLIVFNAAVNSSGKRGYKMLQASLNVVTNAQLRVEGSPGMITVAAANHAPDHDAVVLEFGRKYQAYYRSLSDWKRYGKGWTRRNKNVTEIANAWATGSVGPQPATAMSFMSVATGTQSVASDDGMHRKARDETITQESVGAGGSASLVTAGATGTGGLEAWQDQIESTKSSLSELAYLIDWVQTVLIVLTVAGILFGFYAAYKQRKYKRINEAIDSAEIPDLDLQYA